MASARGPHDDRMAREEVRPVVTWALERAPNPRVIRGSFSGTRDTSRHSASFWSGNLAAIEHLFDQVSGRIGTANCQAETAEVFKVSSPDSRTSWCSIACDNELLRGSREPRACCFRAEGAATLLRTERSQPRSRFGIEDSDAATARHLRPHAEPLSTSYPDRPKGPRDWATRRDGGLVWPTLRSVLGLCAASP
jgi:hypothetical protein